MPHGLCLPLMHSVWMRTVVGDGIVVASMFAVGASMYIGIQEKSLKKGGVFLCEHILAVLPWMCAASVTLLFLVRC